LAILPANIAFVTAKAEIVNAVEAPVVPEPVTSPVNVNAPLGIETADVVTDVTRPFALTVTTGIDDAEPNVPTLLLTVANVDADDTLPDPSNAKLVQATSPLIAIVLAVANAVAVLALPVNAPVKPVEVTEVKPANVVDVAPSAVDVEPIVTVVFVNEVLGILPKLKAPVPLL
jgi:hypothetical protein